MKGTRFNAGQIYVALSRVKKLCGLHIVNFNAKAIKKSTIVDDEMVRLRENLLQTVPPMRCFPFSTHITLAVLNVRSIVGKLPDIEGDIELCNANVLCFCETWLSPAQPSPVINTDHVVLRCDRVINNHKGGTMISVPNSMQPDKTVTFVSSGIEIIVTVLHISGKRLQVAVVYRSPNIPVCQFMQLLGRFIEHANTNELLTIVLGDFNDDFLCDSNSRIHDLMMSHSYTQLVKDATTDRATLIDHVYFNCCCDEVEIQVRDVYYSDHDAIYCSIPVCLL